MEKSKRVKQIEKHIEGLLKLGWTREEIIRQMQTGFRGARTDKPRKGDVQSSWPKL